MFTVMDLVNYLLIAHSWTWGNKIHFATKNVASATVCFAVLFFPPFMRIVGTFALSSQLSKVTIVSTEILEEVSFSFKRNLAC